MKHWLLLLAFVAGSMLAAGCSEDDVSAKPDPETPVTPPDDKPDPDPEPNPDPDPDPEPNPDPQPDLDPQLALSVESLTFDPFPESGTEVDLTTNSGWSVAVEYDFKQPDWLKVSPESGKPGETRLTVTARENTMTVVRNASLVFSYGGEELRVKVRQRETDTKLAVSGESSFLFEADDKTKKTVRFEVNRMWFAAVDYKDGEQWWLRLDAEEGGGASGTGELSFSVAENPSGRERTADIVITCKGKRITVPVRQQGVNLAERFDPLFARELERKGYIADATHIPPEEVRGIETLELNGNLISSAEPKTTPERDSGSVYDGELTSLRGLEYFESLKNLECSGNRLTELDLSRNAALENLYCHHNRIKALDVSRNAALKVLYCHHNRIKTLDVTRNPALIWLHCDYNELESLDVTHNPELSDLDFAGNRLTAIDLTGNERLNCFDCEHNLLTALDLSQNLGIRILRCADNWLTELDISPNDLLRSVRCSDNPGDGSIFPLTVWFDNDHIPFGFSYSFETNWTYDGKPIKLEFRKR